LLNFINVLLLITELDTERRNCKTKSENRQKSLHAGRRNKDRNCIRTYPSYILRYENVELFSEWLAYYKVHDSYVYIRVQYCSSTCFFCTAPQSPPHNMTGKKVLYRYDTSALVCKHIYIILVCICLICIRSTLARSAIPIQGKYYWYYIIY